MTRNTEFRLQDSTGQSVQKVLSMTINRAPTPLAILTNSFDPGSINQFYAEALSGTGGTTPYTWGLKAGSPPSQAASRSVIMASSAGRRLCQYHSYVYTDR